MRINHNKLAYLFGALLLASMGARPAQAISYTQSGTFSADTDVITYAFTLPTAQTVNFFTTSYGGGANLDGSMSAAGGFLPSLTLFSVGSGLVVDCGAAGSTCSGLAMGPTKVDPMTNLAGDVNFTESLSAGAYLLALTEFPNVAIGGINDGFLVSLDSTLFSDACGSTGTFLESDIAPCAQRNGKFSFNVGTVPEPATFWLALPVLAYGMLVRKRLWIRS